MTLAELAHKLERPFEDVLIDVIGPDGAKGAYFVMNDELLNAFCGNMRFWEPVRELKFSPVTQ